MGDDVSVLICWLSQWVAVAFRSDAIWRAEVTAETTRLSTSSPTWKSDELICASHIVPLTSVTRRVNVSFFMRNKTLPFSLFLFYPPLPSKNAKQKQNSSLLVSQRGPFEKRWSRQSALQTMCKPAWIGRKRGNENPADKVARRSHVCSGGLTVTDGEQEPTGACQRSVPVWLSRPLPHWLLFVVATCRSGPLELRTHHREQTEHKHFIGGIRIQRTTKKKQSTSSFQETNYL